MKKFLVFLLLAGCGPLAVDFTVGWGSNQTIDKTLKMNQKQTKAQTEAESQAVSDILDALPGIIASAQKVPPSPPPHARLPLEVNPAPTPTPCPVVYERKVVRKVRRLPPAKKPLPPAKKPSPCATATPIPESEWFQKHPEQQGD